MTQEASPTFRINIAFTPDAELAAKRILDRFPIGIMVDVARLGVAYALREGVGTDRPADFGVANGANYNVGSIDPVGQLREVILALRPDLNGDPNRVIETLMSLGTLAIDAKIASGEILSLADVVGDVESS